MRGGAYPQRMHQTRRQIPQWLFGAVMQGSTFGTPGVEEHALFLRDVANATAIRSKLIDNWILANIPGCALSPIVVQHEAASCWCVLCEAQQHVLESAEACSDLTISLCQASRHCRIVCWLVAKNCL